MRRRPTALVVTALAAVAVLVPAAGVRAQATDGTIVTAAGSVQGSGGDGGPATQARVDTPLDVAYLTSTSFVIADSGNDRIRQVLPDGTMTTVAGSDRGMSGDGGPATDAQLDRPAGVTALPGGAFLIADTFNDRVRRVAADGTITTIAGSARGFGGDGGPATAAMLNRPTDTATLPDGSVLIADTGNNRIRRIDPDGMIATIAGTGAGFGGDGGPATTAALSAPRDIAVATDGAILVADTGNSRIRRIAADGTISTVAGSGPGAGFAGDGDPAATAQLAAPGSVVPLSNGGFAFTDTGNHRVRRVTPLGAIFTVVGTGPGRGGDGGPAKAAQLSAPGGLTVVPGRGLLVADTGNAVVRQVSDVGAVPAARLGRSVRLAPVIGAVTVTPVGRGSAARLAEEDLVPTGSAIDATTGRLTLATAADTSGTQQRATIYDGPFTVLQGASATPFTTFRLPPLTGCAGEPARAARGARGARAAQAARGAQAGRGAQAARGARAAQASQAVAPTATSSAKRRKKKRRKRGLWVEERGGRWRSSTGSTSASAIGTRWRTTLLCDGTLIRVTEGRVRVFDRIRGRAVVVRAGQSTLVRTRGTRRGL